MMIYLSMLLAMACFCELAVPPAEAVSMLSATHYSSSTRRNPSFAMQRAWERQASTVSTAAIAAKIAKTKVAKAQNDDIDDNKEDYGPVLNVSPMLARGDVAGARKAAAVSGLGPQLDGSFSALVTTDAAKNDSMWFWWIPAQSEQLLQRQQQQRRRQQRRDGENAHGLKQALSAVDNSNTTTTFTRNSNSSSSSSSSSSGGGGSSSSFYPPPPPPPPLHHKPDATATAPTVVWLQGGPGAPSTYGFFSEIGPVVVQADGSLKDRPEAWNKHFALLVIDNPSGVGFSPLGDTSKPVTNEEMVGRQLTEVLRQWTIMFPERQHLSLFIAGESYGGKYGPSAAAAVHTYNSNLLFSSSSSPSPSSDAAAAAAAAGGAATSNFTATTDTKPATTDTTTSTTTKSSTLTLTAAEATAAAAAVHTKQPHINLRGLVIADGWCDPATHAAGYASMMYGQGLVDQVQRVEIERRMQETIGLIGQNKLTAAFDGWNSVWGDYGGDYPGKSFNGPCLFDNYTGGGNTENIWFSGSDPNIPDFAHAYAFLNRPSTRRALHIGNLSMSQVDQYRVMVGSGDVMNSSRPAIEAVLRANQYHVLAYNGAWDGVVGAAVSEPLYTSGLEWDGKAAFAAGARHPYKVSPNDTQVAGFVRSVRVNGTRFVRVVVRRAGHILPADEPRVARDMMEKFVFDREFGP